MDEGRGGGGEGVKGGVVVVVKGEGEDCRGRGKEDCSQGKRMGAGDWKRVQLARAEIRI